MDGRRGQQGAAAGLLSVMFTGLIAATGRVLDLQRTEAGARLTLDCEGWHHGATLGDSVAINGVCLTVASPDGVDGAVLRFDVIGETLAKTTLGNLEKGQRVNLEASLRVGDQVGGHFVQGHVDAVAEVLEVQDDPGDWRVWFGVPEGHEPAIVPKGSVTIEGVSLTIAEVASDRFAVALIPTTLGETTLGELAAGGRVNVETDILARTVAWSLARVGRVE